MLMDNVLQLLAHGMAQASAWQIVAYTLVTTHLTIVAVTVYLHRCQAHRALELHPALSHLFRFWLWLATGMITREWVAVHRKHHARCEQDGDPHSPVLFGIRTVLLQGTELYQREARIAATLQRYGSGTPDDWVERHVYARHSWQGVALLLIADLLLFGAIGATVWAVQMLWIPIGAAGIVNGLGHYFGYRNFDGPTAASNIVPLGILIGGEELHNNHHTFPTSAKLSARWFELDIGWCYIRLFQALGLARVRALPSKPVLRKDGAALNIETVKSIIANRHYVMRNYGVMLMRALRDELRLLRDNRYDRRFLRHARRLLRRDPAYVPSAQQGTLAQLLTRHQALAYMQAMRAELGQLWERKNATPQELLAHLRDWCERAERSGLPRLRNFALRLQAYA
jgi:stearoyl-CoA desaturase (delta-9 desaturase)